MVSGRTVGAEGVLPVQSTSVTWSQIPVQFPGGSPFSSAISLAHGMEPFRILLPQSLPSAGITSTVRSRWQFSHYSECSITQENVEAILIILFNSGRKIWQSMNVSCSPTLKVLYECHSPPNNQKWVSWVQMGKSKIINKLDLQVNGWLASGKILVKLSWLEGHITSSCYLYDQCLSNKSSVLEVRLGSLQFFKASIQFWIYIIFTL